MEVGTGSTEPDNPAETIDPLTETDVETDNTRHLTTTTSVDTAGQTAGVLVSEDDDSDMSAVPIGVTLVGFGAGAAHIGPEEYEQKKPVQETVSGGDTYSKMKILK